MEASAVPSARTFDESKDRRPKENIDLLSERLEYMGETDAGRTRKHAVQMRPCVGGTELAYLVH